MKFLLTLSRWIDALNEGVGRVVLWLVVPMVAVGAYNAIGRSLDKSLGTRLASNTYFELQWYLFSLIFLLMVGYVLKHNGHIRVDVVYARLGERGRAWVDMLGSILFLVPFSLMLFYVSLAPVSFSVQIREMSPDAGGLPRWPLKLAMLPAFILLALQGFSEFVKNLAYLRGYLPRPPYEPEGEVA
ncbi:C4-dicarboxylate ABC transporter substrate-binding protein [Meiothermus sp. QL-1]|uniref:TRAP transporter small permease subunit n=1 Tax=Meiothermus sp. QL-1 TaxID=2058095 RepID=UPI000E0BAD0C|nr:TRAP transporter small permease subunit [Meiothermus sp. QL-1]RDI95053.1 C4-dicarboxylate ABC transporter substrate-binding protein [Meiothermus sp. QL-1]